MTFQFGDYVIWFPKKEKDQVGKFKNTKLKMVVDFR
jgi:hypothetical protein